MTERELLSFRRFLQGETETFAPTPLPLRPSFSPFKAPRPISARHRAALRRARPWEGASRGTHVRRQRRRSGGGRGPGGCARRPWWAARRSSRSASCPGVASWWRCAGSRAAGAPAAASASGGRGVRKGGGRGAAALLPAGRAAVRGRLGRCWSPGRGVRRGRNAPRAVSVGCVPAAAPLPERLSSAAPNDVRESPKRYNRPTSAAPSAPRRPTYPGEALGRS